MVVQVAREDTPCVEALPNSKRPIGSATPAAEALRTVCRWDVSQRTVERESKEPIDVGADVSSRRTNVEVRPLDDVAADHAAKGDPELPQGEAAHRAADRPTFVAVDRGWGEREGREKAVERHLFDPTEGQHRIGVLLEARDEIGDVVPGIRIVVRHPQEVLAACLLEEKVEVPNPVQAVAGLEEAKA